mgnify:FL=1
MAKNIGHGTIKGIKVFDAPGKKQTYIFFDDSANLMEEACNGAAIITHTLHEPEAMQQMVSVALAAYMGGKKIRAYSYTDGSCETDMISIQELYF